MMTDRGRSSCKHSVVTSTHFLIMFLFVLCKSTSDHLSLQHVSLQTRSVLLGAVGPADGQAVGLPLLLRLAGGGAAPALHRHRSVQTWWRHSLEVWKSQERRWRTGSRPGCESLTRQLRSVGNIRRQRRAWRWLYLAADTWECVKQTLSGYVKVKQEGLLRQKLRSVQR